MPSLNELYLKKIGISISIGLLLAILIVISSGRAEKSSLLEGDFPGFYVLAKIISDYDSANLYDLDLQTKIQNEHWPTMAGGVLISVYPPSTAIILSPLGFLSAETAQFLFRLLSFCALFYSFLYLKRKIADNHQFDYFLFSFLLSQPFILIGTLGGQNTAFSLAILCLSLNLLEKSFLHKSNKLQALSGLAFSLWLLKPQYGIFIFPALLFFRLRFALIGFTSGAFLHYLAGCLVFDFKWPLLWINKISLFSDINYQTNINNQASLSSVLKLIFEFSGLPDYKLYLGALLLSGLAAFYVFIQKIRTNTNQTVQLFWLYISLIILLSPQALFYDLGIASFVLLILISRRADTNLKVSISLWFFSWLAVLNRDNYGFIIFPLINSLYFYNNLRSCQDNHYDTKNIIH